MLLWLNWNLSHRSRRPHPLSVAPTGIEFNSYPASASQVVGNYASVPLRLAHRFLKSKWDFELDIVVLPIILAAGESEAGVWLDSS